MRILLLLFFAFTAPVVIFMYTILYGGISNDSLKKALAESNTYTKISNYFTQKDASIEDEFQTFSKFASKRLSAEYIKSKTESAVDDSANWITGKTEKSPSISFKEIKDDLAAEDPALFETLNQAPPAQDLADSSLSEEEKAQYVEQSQQLQKYMNSDFTVPIGEHLQGLKTVYGYLKIVLPILAVIMLGCLIVIVLNSHGLYAKSKWLGATFMVTALIGFGWIFVNTLLSNTASQINIAEQPDLAAFMAPVLVSIFKHFADVYAIHQMTASTSLFVLSMVLLIAAFITRNQAAKSLKPLNVGKSFWTQPSKKKK